METYVDFHSQLASIMEVLANAAVAEICQLVDYGFATLRLEISRSQRENQVLKSRLRLLEVRSGEQSHREPTPPPLVVTCARKDHHLGEDGLVICKKKVTLENAQRSQLLEPEVVVLIKKERLEEELPGCSVLEDRQTVPNSSIGHPSLSLAAEGDRPLSAEAETPRVSTSGQDEKQDFDRPEAQQQDENEGVAEGRYSHPADESQRAPLRGSGPNRAGEMMDSIIGGERQVVDASNSLPDPDVETPMMKTLDSELSLTAGVKGLCGAGADWRGEATKVKPETEPSWSEALRTHNPLVAGTECVSNSNSQHTESGPADLDTSSLDSSSFDDLFSSPEVARSLTASLRHSADGVTGVEEPLSSSSFPFLSSGSSFGSSLASDSLTAFSNASSDSRSFPRGTERAFSCQQCSRHFSTSRDLAVHQRCHAGERIYHCHLCKKPFTHPHQLKTHQRVHTGEKPFSCAQCGKRFSQSSHIKRHMSVHTGEKRYSCGLCGKRFSQACSLKVHQAVHTGERPYSCTKCGKSFSVLGNLVRHQSVHISK